LYQRVVGEQNLPEAGWELRLGGVGIPGVVRIVAAAAHMGQASGRIVEEVAVVLEIGIVDLGLRSKGHWDLGSGEVMPYLLD
jgi:hypothetical protein